MRHGIQPNLNARNQCFRSYPKFHLICVEETLHHPRIITKQERTSTVIVFQELAVEALGYVFRIPVVRGKMLRFPPLEIIIS